MQEASHKAGRVPVGAHLQGEEGLKATLVRHADDGHSVIRLSDGTAALVNDTDIHRDPGGNDWRLAMSQKDVAAALAGQNGGADQNTVIPLISEHLRVDKVEEETGRVRIRKTVREEEEHLQHDLLSQDVHVERVPVDKPVENPDRPPESRHEGDTLIIPLLEEVLVVQKRLMLREELHVTRKTHRHKQDQTVTVKREEADVQRLPPD
ncbi:MAG: YsnF/AvaK domain-containing protein [Phycisphaerae bacterium]